MSKTLFTALLAIGLGSVLSAGAQDEVAPPAPALEEGLYARIHTAKGEILCRLFFEQTPLTVANFSGLAEGTKASSRDGKPFFDGLNFHRVVRQPRPFVIQGGCPLGNGTGNPGYRFEDEFVAGLQHDTAGILSMANSGKDTNGSQFFITLDKTPWLDGRHTVFGRVVSGMETVNKIVAGDLMEKVEIVRVGAAAEAFKNDEAAFQALRADVRAGRAAAVDAGAAAREKKLAADTAKVEAQWPNAIKTASGLRYLVNAEGTGEATPTTGVNVSVHYEGKLLDGSVFDSSVKRGVPHQFALGRGRAPRTWDEAVSTMKKGEKRTLLVPPELGYGRRGAGRVIPPDAWLIYELELVDF